MAQGLALTSARWATWVGQRHEWNGYLWIRWSDAEAILLFIAGRPRIHLCDPQGWTDGEHALTAVAQRLERLPPPRWGQVTIPARWAAAMRDLTLVHPALPAEVVSPAAWVSWARAQRFSGLAALVGEEPAAWIFQDGAVRAVRFQQGAVVADNDGPPPAEGLLQVYRGRVGPDLAPAVESTPPVPFTASLPGQVAASLPGHIAASLLEGLPRPQPFVFPAAAPPPPAAAEGVVEAQPPAPAAFTEIPAAEPVMSAHAEAPPTPAAQISPSAPAEPGETTVVQARSETSRRFRGDERFLLAPTVDLANPEALADLLTVHGAEILRWLRLLDGSRTLEEVARAGAVAPGDVDAVVAILADRHLVFRYTARPRAASPS